jgi:hypothetical protein
MTVVDSDPGVFELSVTAAGAKLAPADLGHVVELVVDNRLRVPDRLQLSIRDDEMKVIEAGTFALGTAVTVTMAGANEPESAEVFDGVVSTLVPTFASGAANLDVLALDRGCLLQRAPHTATFQEMSYGGIATKIAGGSSLAAGDISDGLTVPFVQQSNETDWDFLWRLALEIDYEVKVTGKKLNFRPAGGAAGTPISLAIGDRLRSFSPRVTGVGQVDKVTVRGWDPATAEAIVGSKDSGKPQAELGLDTSELASALGTGTASVVDRPVVSTGHATAVAAGLASRLANASVEGEGLTGGTPGLRAGGTVKIEGVGRAFSGTYAVSGVRHVLRATTGYETYFYVAGREDRSLLGLVRSPGQPREGWTHRIVVGVVTNAEDPDELGRVRVTYPTLDGQLEGWWARIVAPGAGVGRGLLTLPLVGDEVLVAFEHGSDQHPYVLGSVYNGQSKPGELLTKDGTYSWASAKAITMTAADRVALSAATTLTLGSVGDAKLTTNPGDDEKAAGNIEVSSKGSVSVSSETDTTVSATGALAMSAKTTGELKADQSVTVSAPQSTVSGNQSLTLSGGTQVSVTSDGQLEIKGLAVKITSTGPLQISAPTVMFQ